MRARLLPVVALALALPGCAVLTIDVDVYKGALANHESVQTEQVAAMAMGAKPLLAELRYKLEQVACFKKVGDEEQNKGGLAAARPVDDNHPAIRDTCPGYHQTRSTANFLPPNLLQSRDAQRVNEILSLYEDSAATGASQILRSVTQAAARLIERFKAGKPTVMRYIGDGDKKKMEQRAEALAKLTWDARYKSEKKSALSGAEKSRFEAVQSVWEAAEETWQEAIRVLSSEEIRSRLKKIPGDPIWDVAWVAAELTSGEGLRRFFTRTDRPAADSLEKTEPLAKLQGLLEVLRVKGTESDKILKPAEEDAVESVLAQMLADEKTGAMLATQLAMAQGFAMSKPEQEWSIVIYPAKQYLSDPDIIFVKDLETLLERRPLEIALGAGRPDKGLEKLIDEYLRAKGLGSESERQRGADDKRKKLFDALVNFAEKVTIIANFDPLLRDRHEDTRKYVRVLQAVGNSILSQVDALRQSTAHKDGLTRARDIELAGLRGAETRAAAVLKNIQAELTAKPPDFPGRDDILAKLGAAQDALVVAGNRIGQELVKQRDQLGKDKVAADKAIAAHSVTVRTEVKRAVETFGSAHPSVTTAEVATELARVLGEQEARSRRTDGLGSEEAQRLRLASEALNEARFTGDTANPGPALTKYDAIVRALGRDRDDAEKAVTKLTPIVADLDRWHRQVTAMTSGGKPSLAFPGRLEKDGGDGTAKEVLDVMLATLRYEHVAAVANDRNSEISKSRAAAVDLLYAYRSGIVHIRPASVFLRNSYPATILQQDPTAGFWRNMLTDHAWRQLPFYEFFYGKSHEDEIKINKTIDKQFWQSVNQVRVAGAGRTNYAIAKDDVGNWYVKSYSSNPEDIINSAKNLALFAAGPALGANFLSRGGSAQRSGLETLGAATGTSTPTQTGTVTAPTTTEARSTLGKQFDRVSKRYDEQTLAARKNLKEEIEGLNGKLSRAVSDRVGGDAKKIEDAKVFTPLGGKAIEDLGQDKGTDGKSKPASILNAEIAAALRAVKRYRNDVQARVTTMTVAQGQTPAANQLSTEAGTQAKQAVDATVRELLERSTKERQTATVQYESTLLLIGESAGL